MKALQEVKQTAFRLGGIVEPPDAPRGYVEFQFQPNDGFSPRFFSETQSVFVPAWIAGTLAP